MEQHPKKNAEFSHQTTLLQTGDGTTTRKEVKSLDSIPEPDHFGISHSEINVMDDSVEELRKKAQEVEDRLNMRVLKLATQTKEQNDSLESTLASLEEVFHVLASILATESDHVEDSSTSAQLSNAKKVLSKHGISLEIVLPITLKAKMSHSIILAERLKEEKKQLEERIRQKDYQYSALEDKYSSLLSQTKKQDSYSLEEKADDKAQLCLKNFENERLHLLLLESDGQVKDSRCENDLLKTTIESLKEQLIRSESELQSEVQQKTAQLKIYEQIEEAVDKMIIDAAEKSGSIAMAREELHKFGCVLPTAASRRMVLALEQTLRAKKLEQELMESKNEIFELYDEREASREEINTMKSCMSQPVGKLISKIIEKNATINKLEARVRQLEDDVLKVKSGQRVHLNAGYLKEDEKLENLGDSSSSTCEVHCSRDGVGPNSYIHLSKSKDILPKNIPRSTVTITSGKSKLKPDRLTIPYDVRTVTSKSGRGPISCSNEKSIIASSLNRQLTPVSINETQENAGKDLVPIPCDSKVLLDDERVVGNDIRRKVQFSKSTSKPESNRRSSKGTKSKPVISHVTRSPGFINLHRPGDNKGPTALVLSKVKPNSYMLF